MPDAVTLLMYVCAGGVYSAYHQMLTFTLIMVIGWTRNLTLALNPNLPSRHQPSSTNPIAIKARGKLL